mmetsp:Transcript_142640/g.248730  ORF Transcript_142640/g.248730 Transcript_142640/m.248730 type:complete len:535 (+) Transcript_142640:160-1764(+)
MSSYQMPASAYQVPRSTGSTASYWPTSSPGLSYPSPYAIRGGKTYTAASPFSKASPDTSFSPPLEEILESRPYSEYTAEFVGTFLLVYTAGVVSIVGDPTWNATAVGLLLMVLVYAFRPVSGGHLNPAVSIALGLLRKCSWRKVLIYVIVQIFAGILAGVSVSAAFGEGILFGPVPPFGGAGALALEFIYTAMLCFVFLSCTTSSRNNPAEDQNNFFGLAIGFVLVAGGYAAGSVSGASFNPALSIGLACTSFSESIRWAFSYTLVEVFGGMLACALFYLCHPEDFAVHTREFAPGSLSLRLLSEFLGTFVVVLTVGLNLVTRSGATAWSTAAALTSMTYSLAGVSGAHFNPAVTLAVVLCGRQKCRAMVGLAYGTVQLAAGVLAGFIYQHYQVTGKYADYVFGLAPAEITLGGGSVLAAEFVFTFGLVYAVLACATTTLPASPSSSNFYFGLAIGFSLAAGSLASGAVSGGILNPAVASGVSVGSHVAWRGTDFAPPPWTYCLWYTLVELLAGFFAALSFHWTHVAEYTGKSY